MFRCQAGPAGLYDQFHAVGNVQAADDFYRSTAFAALWNSGILAGQQLANAVQCEACSRPLFDEQQLVKVFLPIAGRPGFSFRAVNQSLLHVVPHRADRQIHQGAQFVERIDGSHVQILTPMLHQLLYINC